MSEEVNKANYERGEVPMGAGLDCPICSVLMVRKDATKLRCPSCLSEFYPYFGPHNMRATQAQRASMAIVKEGLNMLPARHTTYGNGAVPEMSRESIRSKLLSMGAADSFEVTSERERVAVCQVNRTLRGSGDMKLGVRTRRTAGGYRVELVKRRA